MFILSKKFILNGEIMIEDSINTSKAHIFRLL